VRRFNFAVVVYVLAIDELKDLAAAIFDEL
jgi:hypothetical protein